MLMPYGIRTLADLQQRNCIAPLIDLLTDKLSEIIFFDFKHKTDNLTEHEALKWYQYSNPNFWADLTRSQRHKEHSKFEKLKQKYHCIDWAKFLTKKTVEAWNELLNKKRRHFPQHYQKSQAKKTNKKRRHFPHLTLTVIFCSILNTLCVCAL